MTPDWVPPLHLLLGPAPLVLFAAAFVTDLAALLVRAWRWGVHMATGLYVVAGAVAVAVYLAPVDGAVALPDAALSVADRHTDWGWYAMLAFALYALVRLAVSLLPDLHGRPGVHAVLVALALSGGYIGGVVATTGSALLFQHGAGVAAVAAERAPADTSTALPDSLLGLQATDAGWTWRPNAPGAWKDRMTWLTGSPPLVRSFLFEPEGAGQRGLALQLDGEPVLFVGPPTLGDVEATVAINTDDFDGTVRVVHHVRGARYYDYVGWTDALVVLGRMEGTQRQVFDRRDRSMQGWQRIRVIGAGTNFSAFVDDTMVVDADENPAGPGQVGLYLNGTGLVRIRQMAVQELEDAV